MSKKFIIILLLSSFAKAQVVSDLPELGDRVSGAISEVEVELLSEQFLQQVYSQAALIIDPTVQELSLIHTPSPRDNRVSRMPSSA